MKTGSDVSALQKQILDGSHIDAKTGCRLWTGYADKDGYGRIIVTGNEVPQRTHRISYVAFRGTIPAGKWVLHRCDNPGCVNPDHLFLGDHDINMEDMVTKGRGARGEKNGQHKLTWNDIPMIRLLYIAGATQCFLGKHYGVSQPAIGYIVRGERWRDSDTDQRMMQEYWLALVAHT